MQIITASYALLGVFATYASATIALGRTGGQINVAWIEGDDPCGGTTTINPEGQNPCGIKFTLHNGYTYQLGNCGDPIFSVLNEDGSFNAQCVFDSEDLGCGIQKNWRC